MYYMIGLNLNRLSLGHKLVIEYDFRSIRDGVIKLWRETIDFDNLLFDELLERFISGSSRRYHLKID